MSILRLFLILLLPLLLSSCLNNEMVDGNAILGNLENAAVNIFKVNDNGTLSLLWQEKTSGGKTLDRIGKFNLHIKDIDDNSLYLFKISGGEDWDADDNGVMDETPTTNYGTIRAFATGKQIKKLKGSFKVTFLSEIEYRYLEGYLGSNFNKKSFLDNMTFESTKLIAKSINDDNITDQLDLLYFYPVNDIGKLSGSIKNSVKDILNDIHSNSDAIRINISTITTKDGASSIKVSGNYGFFVENSSIGVVDLSNIGAPKVLFYINDEESGNIYSIDISNNRLFVADDAGVEIFDIKNPQKLKKLSTVNIQDARYIAVSDNVCFVSTAWNRLYSIDITDAKKPVIASYIETPRMASALYLEGGYLYLTDSEAGLIVVDISDCLHPKIISKTAASYANNLIVIGSYAFVADMDDGLLIFNVSNKLKPILAGSMDLAVNTFSYDGRYLFVSDADGNIDVLDIDNKNKPTIVYKLNLENVIGVYTKDSYLFALYKDGNIGIKQLLFD